MVAVSDALALTSAVASGTFVLLSGQQAGASAGGAGREASGGSQMSGWCRVASSTWPSATSELYERARAAQSIMSWDGSEKRWRSHAVAAELLELERSERERQPLVEPVSRELLYTTSGAAAAAAAFAGAAGGEQDDESGRGAAKIVVGKAGGRASPRLVRASSSLLLPLCSAAFQMEASAGGGGSAL